MLHLYRQELEQQATTYEMYVFDHITDKPMPLKRQKPLWLDYLHTLSILLLFIAALLILFRKW